ncbi:MAG TPA: hypothetical protein DD624_09045, partial [Alphaproteobacteria bacterium]|nr:hypothetical protein [Alphaproteobacteria bacterium]
MDILFKKTEISSDGILIVGVYENITLSKTAKKIDAVMNGGVTRSLKRNGFYGKFGETYCFTALNNLPVKRL